jgi:hypothetical protein
MSKSIEQTPKNLTVEPENSLNKANRAPDQPLANKNNQKILDYCQNLENLLN